MTKKKLPKVKTSPQKKPIKKKVSEIDLDRPPTPVTIARTPIPAVMGRTRRLSTDIIQTISNYLLAGAYPETAAAAVGLHPNTFRIWLHKGNEAVTREDKGEELSDEDKLYRDLVLSVNYSVAHAEMKDVQRIDMAGEADWRAVAWKMKHRWGMAWSGPEKTVKHTHEGDISHQHTHTTRELDADSLPPEVCEQLISAMKKTGAETLVIPHNALPIKEIPSN